jgi:Predicted nucleotidyltransferase
MQYQEGYHLEIDTEKQKYVIDAIKGKLPAKANILFLSLTGSRAFGWADSNQDYDIHGAFLCDNYWDWIHDGKNGFDINLYELNHIYGDIIYQHFEEFMNFSNPFLVNERFDYTGLMQFCTLYGVKQVQADIQAQINTFKYERTPRAALHAYRIAMVPLYFFEHRKFILNVFKLNEEYRFAQLDKLKEAHNKGHSQYDQNKVLSDLEYLQKLYSEKVATCEEKVDTDKAAEWIKTVKEVYTV